MVAITLEGDANGAPHPDPAVYAEKFTGKYTHADAVVEVDGS